MGFSVIITGTTGFVGEGVLLACLDHPEVDRVLMVNRRTYKKHHPKLSECIVPDFLKIEEHAGQLTGYDACFFCAGISSVGVTEKEYTHITYDTTMHFAETLAKLNPGMVFTYVTGGMTDSSEKGKIMWARVKGRTENALMKLPFRGEYNFRPGFMKASKGQVNIKAIYKLMDLLYPVLRVLTPKMVCTLEDVGMAMINCVLKGYSKQVLEVEDIKILGTRDKG
jgi:uncharacterized protein YbjT (DUF2867 family)